MTPQDLPKLDRQTHRQLNAICDLAQALQGAGHYIDANDHEDGFRNGDPDCPPDSWVSQIRSLLAKFHLAETDLDHPPTLPPELLPAFEGYTQAQRASDRLDPNSARGRQAAKATRRALKEYLRLYLLFGPVKEAA